MSNSMFNYINNSNLAGLTTLVAVASFSSGQVVEHDAVLSIKAPRSVEISTNKEKLLNNNFLEDRFSLRAKDNFFNREQLNFIDRNSELENLVKDSIKALGNIYDNFSYQIELIEDPVEAYEQLVINIHSTDIDSFEKYEKFVDEWLVKQTVSLENINFDIA